MCFPCKAELESLDPIGYLGVNVTSAGLSAQYEKMWRVSFVGSTVEGDVDTMQVKCWVGDDDHALSLRQKSCLLREKNECTYK